MKLCKEKGKWEEMGDLAVLFDFFLSFFFDQETRGQRTMVRVNQQCAEARYERTVH